MNIYNFKHAVKNVRQTYKKLKYYTNPFLPYEKVYKCKEKWFFKNLEIRPHLIPPAPT